MTVEIGQEIDIEYFKNALSSLQGQRKAWKSRECH